ncbi:hypothetical protein ACIGBL_33475 [Streptomyces sp. NPDC085614]|uniref:hypothetical protein n=1 Tax=Streptomyces sp. NPDC085614 TaxID=3365733 RepID=UPI0037D2520D
MKWPFVSRRYAQGSLDLAGAAFRHELAEARAELKAEARARRRAEDQVKKLAARLDEVTAANQSYDKPVTW